ncbi:hypothetical protein ES702_04085 [subsurface metagenome]
MLDLRLQVMISKEILKEIDNYRFEERVGSRGEAVRQLIEDSLKKWRSKRNRKKVLDKHK